MPGRTPVRRDDPDYLREYRAARPRLRERGALQRQAYALAQRRLRDLHPDLFAALYAKAKREVGLTDEGWPS